MLLELTSEYMEGLRKGGDAVFTGRVEVLAWLVLRTGGLESAVHK